jgi:quercetin dioxygenase-like cupin family protein
MNRRVTVYRWEDLPLEKVTEMVTRKAITGARDTLVQAYLKKGALVPQHEHPAEQFVYVLQGALRMRVGGADTTVREGDVLQVPAGAPHQAEALDDTFVLSVTGVPPV